MHLNEWGLLETNRKMSLLSLPWVDSLSVLDRQEYVYEHEGMSYIAEFKLSCAGLGNKSPFLWELRQKECVLCNKPLDELHVVFSCKAIKKFRSSTGLSSYHNMASLRNLSLESTFKNYVNGLDCEGKTVTKQDYAQRGLMLKDIMLAWKGLIGYISVFHSLNSHLFL